MNNTIEYALKMPLDRAFFTIMEVIPGCELWQKNKEKYKNFQQETSYAKPSIVPAGMTEEDIQKIQQKAMRRFYLRPRILFNMVKLIRPSQIKYIIMRLLKFKLI